jgi:uncharacterized membrane protein HdeD (DUF308 family)
LLSRVRRELARPPKVKIPDLSGQEISRASSVLSNSGLNLGAQNKVANNTISEGQIIEQSPRPGTEVEAGSSVSVTISSGVQKASRRTPPDHQVGGHTDRTERAQSPLPALTGSWWAMALRGLVIVIFGLLLLAHNDFPGTFRLYGALMVTADGIVAIIDATTGAGRRRLLLIQGRISILLGLLISLVWLVRDVLVDLYPTPFQVLSDSLDKLGPAPLLVGIWAIIIGCIRIIAAIQLRWDTTNLWLMAISGASLTVFGILFLLPNSGPFPWNLLVPLALVSGIALIAVALRVRDR